MLSCVPAESGRAERQVAARHPEGWRLFHKVVSRKPNALAQRTELYSLTFSGAEKEAKRHPPNPSPSLYGRGVTDYGGKPPYVRGLVWLTEPLPLRGEPWSFYRLARGVSRDVSWLRWGEPWSFYRLVRGVSRDVSWLRWGEPWVSYRLARGE